MRRRPLRHGSGQASRRRQQRVAPPNEPASKPNSLAPVPAMEGGRLRCFIADAGPPSLPVSGRDGGRGWTTGRPRFIGSTHSRRARWVSGRPGFGLNSLSCCPFVLRRPLRLRPSRSTPARLSTVVMNLRFTLHQEPRLCRPPTPSTQPDFLSGPSCREAGEGVGAASSPRRSREARLRHRTRRGTSTRR